MAYLLTDLFVAALLIVPAGELQRPAKPATPSTLTLIGCISDKPGPSGQYTFQEFEGVRRYRLDGKEIRKYAGRRVELVGGPPTRKGLSIRGGLWPSPNAAAQVGASDPLEESVARQPGGGSTTGPAIPEFRVMRLRALEGGCR